MIYFDQGQTKMSYVTNTPADLDSLVKIDVFWHNSEITHWYKEGLTVGCCEWQIILLA